MVRIKIIVSIIILSLSPGIKDNLIGQNQIKADSLKHILSVSDTLSLKSKLDIVNRIAIYSSHPEEKLYYADELLKLAINSRSTMYIIYAIK